MLSSCLSVPVVAQNIFAKDSIARHAVFLELGGNGIAYSVNYDRLISYSENFKTSVRGGVFAQWWNGGAVGFPVEINGLIGKKQHFLEVGLGGMYSYGVEGIKWKAPNEQGKEGYENYSAFHVSSRVGYRLQKAEGGFFFRAAYTPMVRIYTNNPQEEQNPDWFGHWFGIGVGRSF